MKYYVTPGEWVTIAETAGTIQNDSSVPVEISTTPEDGSGIRLDPHESRQYDEMPKYARALAGIGPAILNVVTFRESGSGGGGDDNYATDAEVDEMLTEILS